MRRILLGCCLAVALAVPVTAHAATAPAPFAWGGPDTFPANRTVDTELYSGGTWSYTDRMWDGTGANADGKHREDYFGAVPVENQALTYDMFGAHRLASNGDYLLPWDDTRFPEGSGDLVFVQIHPSADGLDVRYVMNSLGQADSSILTLGINATGGTGDSTFPRNAALACHGCGVDRYVTVWGTGGEVADAAGHAVAPVTGQHVDLAENWISFHVPASALPPLGAAARIWVASGLNDGQGRYMTVGPYQSSTTPGGGTGKGPNVFDLAFVKDDRATVDDRTQADLLARGDAGPASATLRLDWLAQGAKRLVGEPASGPVERVLVSSVNLGKGIDNGTGAAAYQFPEPGSNYHYVGRLQPYLVTLPSGYAASRRYPSVMVLYGFNGFYDELYRLAPTLRTALSQNGYIGVYPLGRGDVQYERDGELDLMEVMADVARTYPVDSRRVHVTGISMGGFGTTKLTTRHPDVFADGGVFVGGEQQDVNVTNDRYGSTAPSDYTRSFAPVVGNLLDTPMFLGAGAADIDAGGAAATAFYEQLRTLGDAAAVRTYVERTHEVETMELSVPALLQMWAKDALAPVPARVSYAFDSAGWFGPLQDDHDAWVGGLRPRSGTQARVDAEALTVPRTTYSVTESRTTGGAAADRSAWVQQTSTRVPAGSRPRSNAMTLRLTNLSAARVNLSTLGVDLHRTWCLDVTSDGPATVTLTGLDFTGTRVSGPAGGTVTASSVVIPVASGTARYCLTN